MAATPSNREVLDPSRCNFCCSADNLSFGNDGMLYCSTPCLEKGQSPRHADLYARERRMKAIHKVREDKLLTEVHIEVRNRALVDRPSLGALISAVVWQSSPIAEGTFVDIGSGSGNVVSYAAMIFPHYFDKIHAIDLVQEERVILDVDAMIAENSDSVRACAPVCWWHVNPADANDLINSRTQTEHTTVQTLLDGAAFVYSADLLFSDDTVNAYRKCLARALRSNPQRTMFYATFHPVSRERTPWTKDATMTHTTKNTPGGTNALHIGQYIRDITIVYARKDKFVAWHNSVVYVVRLVGPANT